MTADRPTPALSLVICTLDESEAIGPVLREVAAVLAPVDFEIIVVDDSADDRTAAVVRAHAASEPRIRLLRRSGQKGLSSAAIAGWDAASGRALAIMDGDGQHDAALLPGMLGALGEGAADLVVASRYVPGGASGLDARREGMSRVATFATRLMLGAPASDPMSGFFVFSRDWFEAARGQLTGVGFKILVDLMTSGPRAPRVAEVRTALRPRAGGVSKLDARVIVELGALLVEKKTRGAVPSRFTLFACVGATGVAVHLTALALLEMLVQTPFWAAQAGAILTAMTWNFFLNNQLTFRDQRLSGAALPRGLLAFYASCAGGAVISEIAASGLHHAGAHWAVAGVAGAGLAAFWNYWSTARAAWRVGDKPATDVTADGAPAANLAR